MNPNDQPSNQSPVSTEYLDQISAAPAPEKGFSIKNILIFGGIALVLVLALLFFVTKATGGQLSTSQQLAGRLYTTDLVVKTTIKDRLVKNVKLRSINTNLSLILENTIRDLTPGFAAKDIKMERIKDNKAIMAKEGPAELQKTLEEARLNGVFDQHYTIEMIHSLTQTKLLMQQLSKGNVGSNMQAALIKGIDNITPIIEQLKDLAGIE